MVKLGLPYKGSKRAIAKEIVDYILFKNPECTVIYDLFGGGGAISLEFASRSQIKKVVYNEINTGIVELFRYITENGVTSDFYNWIDRETFNKHKNDKTWFGGLLQSCWSFGNNGMDYIFGKTKEKDKKTIHNAIVNCEDIYIKEFDLKIKFEKSDSIQERRMDFLKQLRKVKNSNVNYFEKTRRIESLLNIQSLERITFLKKIELSNKSYEDIVVDAGAVIYLDPPYKNTNKYNDDINHEELYNYIRNHQNKIYMSEYDAPFNCVWSMKKIVTLSSTNNKLNKIEKLFTNKE